MKKIILILLAVSLTFSIQGQSLRLLHRLSSQQTQGGNLPGDFGNLVRGYSLRQVESTATLAVRVRRDSDNAETDVELYTDGNSIDLSSTVGAGGDFSTWIGVNSAYITKWYDQGSDGVDVVQTDTAEQPRLVNTGTLETKGSKSCIRYIGGRLLLESSAATALDAVNDYTTITVGANEKLNSLGGMMANGTALANSNQWPCTNGTSDPFINIIRPTGGLESVFSDANRNDFNQRLITTINDGTASTVSAWLNGIDGDQDVAYTGTWTNNKLYVGFAENAAYFLTGVLQEVLIYSDSKDADRTDIETEINDYYSIF